MRRTLTVAGSDCSGGAGVQADLKTFAAHAVYGLSVITAVTAQSSIGVHAVHNLPPAVVEQQLAAVFADGLPDAVKIGMLARAETVQVTADALLRYRPAQVVLDPVMVSSSGHALLQPEGKQSLITALFPLCDLVTPNVPEAEDLAGLAISTVAAMEQAAIHIFRLGPRAVLVKGGHLDGDALDVLFDGHCFRHFRKQRIPERETHGTGCTLSAAIAANLANGLSLPQAVARAKDYVSMAIMHGRRLGPGRQVAGHMAELYQKAGVSIVEQAATQSQSTWPVG